MYHKMLSLVKGTMENRVCVYTLDGLIKIASRKKVVILCINCGSFVDDFFIFLNYCLFIFGCTESSLLCGLALVVLNRVCSSFW